MKAFNKPFLIILLLLNAMVLLGQLWPEGAPPFAGVVNIVTTILDLVLIVLLITRKYQH